VIVISDLTLLFGLHKEHQHCKIVQQSHRFCVMLMGDMTWSNIGK